MNDVYSYTGFNIIHLNNKNKYILIFYVRIIVDVKIANLKDNGLCNGIIDLILLVFIIMQRVGQR